MRTVEPYDGIVYGVPAREHKGFPYHFQSTITWSTRSIDTNDPFIVAVNEWFAEHKLVERTDYLWYFYADKSIFCFRDMSKAVLFRLRFS